MSAANYAAASAAKHSLDVQAKLGKIVGDNIEQFFNIRKEVGYNYVERLAEVADSAWKLQTYTDIENFFANVYTTNLMSLTDYYSKLFLAGYQAYNDTVETLKGK